MYKISIQQMYKWLYYVKKGLKSIKKLPGLYFKLSVETSFLYILKVNFALNEKLATSYIILGQEGK